MLAKLSKTNEKWSEAKNSARKRLEAARTGKSGEAAAIAEHRNRLDQITKELNPLETERIKNARLDQVRRIAGRFHGVNPEDVTVEQANFVALVWFGSLATLAALAGPLTAMVALGLQRMPESDQRQESKLARFVRRWLIRWRYRRVKTVKVPVEVRVEKEVEKIVERPVEKVIKEIFYVPILTDDPDAVQRALREAVPKEIADLVKVTTKTATNGSPA